MHTMSMGGTCQDVVQFVIKVSVTVCVHVCVYVCLFTPCLLAMCIKAFILHLHTRYRVCVSNGVCVFVGISSCVRTHEFVHSHECMQGSSEFVLGGCGFALKFVHASSVRGIVGKCASSCVSERESVFIFPSRRYD